MHSFEFVVYEFFTLFIIPRRTDPGYAARILVVEALDAWAGRDVRTIQPREIIDRLGTIVARGSKVMANRVATIFSELFLHAVHRTNVESSPIQLLYAPGGPERSSDRALSDDEIKIFLTERRTICRYARLTHALTILANPS